MRAPKTGTVDQRGDRWRIRISMPSGDRRAFYTEPGETRQDAERLLASMLIELAGTVDDPRVGTRTLGAWGLTWLEDRARTHRDADGDAMRWNAYVVGHPIASKRLDALKPSDVRQWAKGWLSTPSERTGRLRERGTIANALTTLRACIRAAIEEERMDADVGTALLAVELPRGSIAQHVETEERIDALELHEIAAVLALDLTPDQRSAFTVGVYTGLRAGELHGLDWSRVDFDRAEIVVARSRRAATKSGKVARVPLLAPAFDALRDRWRAAGEPREGLVWPRTRAGKGGARVAIGCLARGFDWDWTSAREVRKVTPQIRKHVDAGACRIVSELAADGTATIEWFGLRERAGIARPITWNAATRHTCACHLLSGTWAPSIVSRAWRIEEVSALLRHATTAVTERHYARFIAGSLPTRPALVRDAGPAGPEGVGSSSRFADLNCGPTVYEGSGPRAESLGKGGNGTSADDLQSVLSSVARGGIVGVDAEGRRALALAVTLLGAMLERAAAVGDEAAAG